MRMPNCLLHSGHTKTRLCPAWYLVSSNVIKLSHLGHLTLFMRLFFYEGYPSVGKGLVTGVPGSKQELEFKFTRAQNGKPFVSYTYNLAKKVDATPDAPVTSNNE